MSSTSIRSFQIFLLALCVLTLEVALTRIFSFIMFHHLTYLVVSVALLGFGAAGTYLTTRQPEDDESGDFVARNAALFGVCAMGAVIFIPRIQFYAEDMYRFGDYSNLLSLLLMILLAGLPFFFAGLCIGFILSRAGENVGQLYFSDLIGAAEEPLPSGTTVFYQKHMTHHLLPEADRDWTDGLVNCFLIRDPREVLLSYVKKRTQITPADLGSEQQIEIFERVRKRTGRVPPVVDGRDVLENPRGLLKALCAAVGVPFLDAMLEWPAGGRETDGVWADHWYDSVRASTSFAPYRPREGNLPDSLAEIARFCEPHYRMLAEHRIRV